MIHTFTIPGYLIPSLNELLRGWWQKHTKKKECAALVAVYARQEGVPPAAGPRRVSILFTLGPRNQKRDEDNAWKCGLDALVKAKLLVDDSPAWVQLGMIAYVKGKQRATTITLEDLY